jgi:hypothetical protein
MIISLERRDNRSQILRDLAIVLLLHYPPIRLGFVGCLFSFPKLALVDEKERLIRSKVGARQTRVRVRAWS